MSYLSNESDSNTDGVYVPYVDTNYVEDEREREINIEHGYIETGIVYLESDQETNMVPGQVTNASTDFMERDKQPCVAVGPDTEFQANKVVEYYPVVPSDLKPCVGMEFESAALAYDFYNVYARVGGFSIRRDRSRFHKDGVGTHEFVCSNEGFRKKNANKDNKFKERSLTRCGCKAKVEFKVMNKSYIVKRFLEGHNHILHTPSKSHLHRSSKNMSDFDKAKIRNLNLSGIGPTQCYNTMVTEAGGFEKLGYTEENVREYIRQLARKTYGNDAKTMLEYFTSTQKENPMFFFSIQVDETGQLLNCFWVDARARLDYQIFGDVVSFDSTYKKNKYLMPFAPFTGVNHHFQSIVFGCALLVDETEASFIWLFKEWLHSMGDRHPTAIITDQDPAMKAAIAKVFPNTIHRFCMWHILQKVPEKLGYIYREHPNFKEIWDKCIYRSEYPDDFEECWLEMINEFDLGRVEWLETLWDIRHMWMPVYLKDVFFAGMSTTQRSESMNDFFKDYVNVNTSLTEFVRKYDRALSRRRELEKRLDFKTLNERPILLTQSLIEKQLSEVLTKKMFRKFQEELLAIGGCSVESVEEYGVVKKYIISHDFTKRECVVSYVASDQTVECSCRKFNFEGIICRHMFTVFRLEKILEFPLRYILRRWRRDARSQHVPLDPSIGIHTQAKNSEAVRYNQLMFLANQCVTDGAIYERGFGIMKEILTNAILQIQQVNKEEEMLETRRTESMEVTEAVKDVTKNQQFIGSQCGSSNTITIVDPKIVRAKGTGKRIGRLCHNCKGTGHDSRNCPKKKQR